MVLCFHAEDAAHAAADGLTLVTRDVGRYRTCFPSVKLVTPADPS